MKSRGSAENIAGTTTPKLVNLSTAASIIVGGGVVAYPTEGVFGLGCDPSNQNAVEHLLSIKSRDPNKGLILIAAHIDQLAPWIQPLEKAQLETIGDSWPGPTTWILPAKSETPKYLTGGRKTIAARVSAHPPVIELCEAVQMAIISTSANLSGQPPAKRSSQLTNLPGVQGCLDAQTGDLGNPTPIIDLRDGSILRN